MVRHKIKKKRLYFQYKAKEKRMHAKRFLAKKALQEQNNLK